MSEQAANGNQTSSFMKDLTKQYDPKVAESRWYPFWESRGYFHADPDPSRTPYTIVIPPPNVTGALHLGHALNNTLQDILIRMKRMQGFNALWIPGTDHAGIATQAVVERRLLAEEGKTRHDVGREGLVARIWAWKDAYEKRILDQLKRMGCSCDWRRTRFTLDPICARAVRHTFFRLFRDGLIYRGRRLVNWDTLLQTAVADDEVFHEPVPGHFWYFRYPVIDPQPGEPQYVTVATTRPETMLGDTAVAVHPDPEAALDKAERELRKRLSTAGEKERIELERELEDLRKRRQTLLPTLLKLRDMARAGRKVLLPLQNRPIPLITDIWAKPEMGTGCVKITPAHDPNDYEVALRHNLPMINILNLDGTLNENAGAYKGQTIMEARQNVVADLEKLGLVEKVEERIIDLAHSDRSKTPIEPLLTDQWFVKMERLAQMAMDAVIEGRVRIIPPRYAKTYLDWLSEKRDWPISRQLWWGHQIPIWYCDTATEKELEAAFAGRDDVVWRWDEEHRQWLICALEDLPADAVPGHTLRREEDVLDTWFSSALWPHSTLGWPEDTPELRYFYPTNTLVTSRDIITLWVARMVLAGLYNVGEVPFRDVYIHPKILDGYGEGMSKSKGNGVDPVDVMEKFGADALRYGLAYLTTETQDIRMPVSFECPHCGQLIEQTRENRILPRITCPHCKKPFATQWAEKPEDKALPRGPVVSERFELARNFCNKLWNASRFVLLNLEGFSPGTVRPDEMLLEDRWLLSRLATVVQQVTDHLENYRFSDAARTLYDFAWDEFCSFYVEMVKVRLQAAESRPPAQRLLVHGLDTLLRLLHPMIPFLTEHVWQLLGEAAPIRGLPEPAQAAESIMIAPWPVASPGDQDRAIEEQFRRFQEVLKSLREYRMRNAIPPAETMQVEIVAREEVASQLRAMLPYFQTMARADVQFVDESEPGLSTVVYVGDGATVRVKLSETERSREIARKRQELAKLEALISQKRKKLENQAFVEKAPRNVVEKERQSLRQLEEQYAAVSHVIAQLGGTT
ncbi:Valyl-tRNA synthetase [Thermogutta terrifontis]|uniref:Valine--tRNA ligase n=1 Tax=Thermogutta terrifontis TaxID=1331910 RepID=A0A286RJ92_9BACT|nr:valine--tRNA ligase [Thermogutta terrifontis]ASV76024.1 Valyl-tRNA synthetase [Thermogutta terrifontis]